VPAVALGGSQISFEMLRNKFMLVLFKKQAVQAN
jgi:hypothetical protein